MKLLVIIGCFVALAKAGPLGQQKRTPIHGAPDYLNFKCEGRADGYYPDLYRGCHQFYHCENENKSTYFCDGNTIFSKETNACIAATTYSCPPIDQPSEIEEFTCERKEDGYYADRARNCQSFYMCSEGTKFTFDCPVGTLFNETLSICDHAENVHCPDPVIEEKLRAERMVQKLRELLKELQNSEN